MATTRWSIAPTGSGKTLAAFLWAIDRLASSEPRPATDSSRRPAAGNATRVLYVSPLKALAVDVERNLRTPLTGIGRVAERRGVPAPDISVGVRSGDTPPAQRRELITKPPDILITTPESLFLMLTSAARETLTEVQTVIVDEVHAVAGTKRGAHLALSLERLDQLLATPAQRIGLSATVRPPEEVARFLSGQARTTIVAPPASQDLRPLSPGAGPGHGRAEQPIHLARRRGTHRRPGRGAPQLDRVRQLAAAGRATHLTAQRDSRRTVGRRTGRWA